MLTSLGAFLVYFALYGHGKGFASLVRANMVEDACGTAADPIDARKVFATRGYTVVKRLLNHREVACYRALLEALRDDPREAARRKPQGGFAHVEGLTQREAFWPLIRHPRLLDAVRGVLGDEVRYVRHSDLHVNYPRDPKWHRDLEEPIEVLDERLARSPAPFGIARAGVYLHDGMRFGIVPGSHRPRRGRTDLPVWWTNLANRALLRISRRHVLTPPIGAMDWLEFDAGDAVLFDIRAIHSGDYPQGPKYAIYLSYGLPNLHSTLHQAQFVAKPEVGGAPMPLALRTELAAAGLYLPEELPSAAGETARRAANEAVPLVEQPS
jgi:hypothetical protein